MTIVDDAAPAPPAGGARHVLQSVAATALVMLVGVVSGVVAARALGVAGRGELAAAILWPAVLTTLSELGLPTAFTYLCASGGRTARQLAGSIVPIAAVQCAVLYAVGIPIVVVVLGGYSDSLRATAAGFLVVYAPMYLTVRYLMALNRGTGCIGLFNLARLLTPALYAVILVALLAAGAVSVRSFAAAYVAGWVVVLVVLVLRSSREIRTGLLTPRRDWATARSAWSVGYRTYFGSLAPIDTMQLDVLLTSSFLGAADAGLYYVATSVGALVRAWGITLGVLSLPRVAAAATREAALAWAAVFARVTVLCSGVLAVIAFVFARPLLALVYGEEFTPATTLVRIIAIGMFAASLRYVLGDGLRGLGAHTTATRAEIAGWVVGGVALAVLLPLWGVTGVALAVSVSYGATLVAMLQSSRKMGMTFYQLLVPTKTDVTRAWSAVGSALHRGDR